MKLAKIVLAVALFAGAAGHAFAEQNFTPVPGAARNPVIAQYQAGPNCGRSRCNGGYRCCSAFQGGWSFWCCRASQQCGSYNDCR